MTEAAVRDSTAVCLPRPLHFINLPVLIILQMKQIAYLTMVFLPASFVAVSQTFSLQLGVPLIRFSLDRIWDERERNCPRLSRNPRELPGQFVVLDLRHSLDYYRLPEQTLLPSKYTVMETVGLALCPDQAPVLA